MQQCYLHSLKGKLHLPSVNCPLKLVPLGPPKHLDSLAVLAHPKSLVIIRPIVALLHLTKKLVVRYSTEGIVSFSLVELIVEFLAEEVIMVDDTAIEPQRALFSHVFQCPIEELGIVLNLKRAAHCLCNYRVEVYDELWSINTTTSTGGILDVSQASIYQNDAEDIICLIEPGVKDSLP
eukprot:scaffold14840_cov127-Skeletonema_menzelii.AAC.1